MAQPSASPAGPPAPGRSPPPSLVACISPTQQLAQGPRRKELQGKRYPSYSQELLQAKPSTGRVSLPVPGHTPR